MNKYTLRFKNEQLEQKFQITQETSAYTMYQYYIFVVWLVDLGCLFFNIYRKDYKFIVFCAISAFILLIMKFKIKKPYVKYLLAIISLSGSFAMLLGFLINNITSTTLIMMDLTYQISVQILCTNTLYIDICCFCAFVITRCVIFQILELHLFTAMFLLLSSFNCWKIYDTTKNFRQQFLLGQINESYDELINFVSEDALIVATFDNYQLHFNTLFKNSIAKIKYMESANELLKNFKLIQEKMTLQLYLYKQIIQNKKTNFSVKVDSYYCDSRIKQILFVFVYTIQETYFVVKIHKQEQINYQKLPFYKSLLCEIKNLNQPKLNMIIQRHLLKNFLLTIQRNRINTSITKITSFSIQQIVQSFSKKIVFTSNINYLITDCRFLIFLIQLCRPRKLSLIRLADDQVNLLFKTSKHLSTQKINMINIILQYIGIGEVEFLIRNKYSCVLITCLSEFLSFREPPERIQQCQQQQLYTFL